MFSQINQSKRSYLLAFGLIMLLILAATPAAAETISVSANTYSGDDLYDPAAGGRPELSVALTLDQSSSFATATYSGDDDYDPAAGGTPELSVSEVVKDSVSVVAITYSGDDDYDPAAGGTPELIVNEATRTVDDPANGAWSVAQAEFYLALYGGPDVAAGRTTRSMARTDGSGLANDPAYGAWSISHAEFLQAVYGLVSDQWMASGKPALEVGGSEVSTERDDPAYGAWSATHAEFYQARVSSEPKLSLSGASGSPVAVSTYSGDDAYDPAAGGTPEASVITVASDLVPEVACTLSAEEFAASNLLTLEGGFSGDDDYDPAAGGRPELSLQEFQPGQSLLVACVPGVFGN